MKLFSLDSLLGGGGGGVKTPSPPVQTPSFIQCGRVALRKAEVFTESRWNDLS